MILSKFSLERFRDKFLDKKVIFAMDLAISLLCSVAVAIVAFFCRVEIIESRPFSIIWGISSVAASGLMFYLFQIGRAHV